MVKLLSPDFYKTYENWELLRDFEIAALNLEYRREQYFKHLDGRAHTDFDTSQTNFNILKGEIEKRMKKKRTFQK